MKTKMFFVAAAVAVISLSSCKKDYECACTVESGGMTITQTAQIPDSKKADAEQDCNTLESNYSGTGATANCTLSEK